MRINRQQLMIRDYYYNGEHGYFLTHRITGNKCLLEGSSARFFEIASGDAAAERAALRELAKKFTLAEERILSDYNVFESALNNSLDNTDMSREAKIRPLLEARRIVHSVMLESTHNCNLRCVHCYIGHRGETNSKKSLLLDRIVVLKMQLAKLGCSNVVLTGGELALAPGILELARELSEDFSLTLLTNGTAWQPSDYVKLAELRLREMRVTLFSLEPRIHDAITGVAGSREKAWRFISAMREIGVPVKINIPVLRQNVSGVPALVKKLDAIGLKAFVEYKCFPGAHMENWRATAGQITELIKSGVVPGLRKSLCGAIRHKLRIAPDGDIFPCEYLNGKIGNIFDAEAIDSVHNSTEAKKVLCAVDTKIADVRCGECAAKGHCFNCIAFNHAEHKNYSKPNEYFCELNKTQAQLAAKERINA